MTVVRWKYALTAALILLAGCNSQSAQTAGGVTPSEAKALDDAAAMLDEKAAATAVPAVAEVPVTKGQDKPTKR